MFSKLMTWVFGRKSRLETLIDTPVAEGAIRTFLLPSTVAQWARQCQEIAVAERYIQKTVPNSMICKFYIIDTFPLTHVLVKCGSTVSEVLAQVGPDYLEDEIIRMIHRDLEIKEEVRKRRENGIQ